MTKRVCVCLCVCVFVCLFVCPSFVLSFFSLSKLMSFQQERFCGYIGIMHLERESKQSADVHNHTWRIAVLWRRRYDGIGAIMRVPGQQHIRSKRLCHRGKQEGRSKEQEQPCCLSSRAITWLSSMVQLSTLIRVLPVPSKTVHFNRTLDDLL